MTKSRVRTAIVLAFLAGAIFVLSPSLYAGSFAKPGAQSAQINGGPGSPNRDVFAIEFTAIDGDEIFPRDILWLEPGAYEITARVDQAYTDSPPRVFHNPPTQDEYVTFQLDLEAGKFYNIRGQYNRNNRQRPYDIIVDRVAGPTAN